MRFLEVRLAHPRASAMPMSCDVHFGVMCEAVTILAHSRAFFLRTFEGRARQQHRLRAAAFVLCDETGIFLVGIAVARHQDQGFTPLAGHDGQPLDELVHLLAYDHWRSRPALFGGSPACSGGHNVAGRVIRQRPRLQHRPSGVLGRNSRPGSRSKQPHRANSGAICGRYTQPQPENGNAKHLSTQ
ncbi:hypothetical protein J2W28_004979 [Variovorax boronicumulans]|uniref:hypothetical protein n=1 Tax=Variovorax boronicumulans TaxID=436515 RepID=UPI00277E8802|nr:hypothetical protein [Variovorax boronicumulans]MDP9994491.1 hypothetical protein [Variovorax boronicumulans]MDQ0005810.1 hypothetical protein [Variovorax boronicumulans]